MSFEQSTMSDCPMPFYTPALHPPPTCTIIWLTVIPLHPLKCFCSLCGTVFRKVIRPLQSSCTKLPTPLNTPSLSNMWQLEPKSYRIKGSPGTQMNRLPVCVCVCAHSVDSVCLFVTPWTIALQAPLSMEFFQARILEQVAISYSRRMSVSINIKLRAKVLFLF